MCGLCGVLGGHGHWTDGADGRGPEDTARTRRHERLRRVASINRLLNRFALTLDDWQGTAYVLASRTGKQQIVNDLSEIWRAAETMTTGRIDPLDPELIRAIEAIGRANSQRSDA